MRSIPYRRHAPAWLGPFRAIAVRPDRPEGPDEGTLLVLCHQVRDVEAFADPVERKGVAGTTSYGIPFCSVYARDNLVATQFHPEKSGSVGLQVYRNFLKFARDSAN